MDTYTDTVKVSDKLCVKHNGSFVHNITEELHLLLDFCIYYTSFFTLAKWQIAEQLLKDAADMEQIGEFEDAAAMAMEAAASHLLQVVCNYKDIVYIFTIELLTIFQLK